MTNRFIHAIAAAADRFLTWLSPLRLPEEFAAAAALVDFEAEHDSLEPGQLNDLPTGAAGAPPRRNPPTAAPVGPPPEFDDLPRLQVTAIDFTDDDIEFWGDMIYLRSLADELHARVVLDHYRPDPTPEPRDIPDFFKDIA